MRLETHGLALDFETDVEPFHGARWGEASRSGTYYSGLTKKRSKSMAGEKADPFPGK